MVRKTLIALLFLVAIPGLASAQYPFGKNKVSYTSRDWKVLATEHVDIYYYPSEQNLVNFVAPLVEDTYVEFAELFNMEFRGRLPLVFYSSHYDFQQTNIIPSLISEYTGGFTDLMKGRIAIPMTGSLWQLRHVIRHEMVHAFMLEKLALVMSGKNRFTYSHPPLWFIEGMAEYFADRSANTQSHMFIRDALMRNRLPDLMNIWQIEGSFMMYKPVYQESQAEILPRDHASAVCARYSCSAHQATHVSLAPRGRSGSGRQEHHLFTLCLRWNDQHLCSRGR
jgi:hypothetical protein